MTEKRLFLLDAYSLIYRSYYAFLNTPMYSSKGVNTSTVFGFMLALDDILKKQKPSHIAVAFDLPKPTFRHEIFPEYKANRQATPEEIKSAVPIIRQIIELMNIPIIEKEGFEADDVIGTIAKMAAKQDFKVYMVTPDKDYCQLVEQNIFIYKPGKSGKESEIWGTKEVLENYSIKNTLQIIDILALWGDSSDNVPGVPGVGEKTSKKLIGEFDSIENIMLNLDKLSPKQEESFLANEKQLFLSKKLVTISLDVPVKLEEEKLLLHPFKEKELKELFSELNFKSLMNRFFTSQQPIVAAKPQTNYSQGNLFDQSIPEIENNINSTTSAFDTIKTVDHKYVILQSIEEIDELNKKLLSVSEFCFDTETTGLDPHNDKLVGISISFQLHEAFYIPIYFDNKEDALEKLSHLCSAFENSAITKIGHNIKFDVLFLHYYNINVQGNFFDTMLAHYLLAPEQHHKMDALAERYLNYTPVPIEDLIGKKNPSQLNMKDVQLDLIGDYASEDADVTFQLKQKLAEEIVRKGFNELFYDLE